MRRSITHCAFVAALLLVAAACQDQPSAPKLDSPSAPITSVLLSRNSGKHLGEVAYYCALSRATAQGTPFAYQYGRSLVYFPKSELRDDGATVRYQYRGHDENGTVVFAANCVVPQTPAAVERIRRHFGVKRNEADSREAITIQSDAIPIDGVITDPVCQWGGYYPNCRTKAGTAVECGAADPNCSGGDDGDGEWGDGGGGDDPDPEYCLSSSDPKCLKPLEPGDSLAIQNALKKYVRPASEFTDSIARKECEKLNNAFQQRMAVDSVYRGAYDSPDSIAHYGATYNRQIHFDPQWLDDARAGDAAAQLELAVTAFHEAGHVLGFSHGAPTWTGDKDYYTETPFKYLNPGPNSCVKR